VGNATGNYSLYSVGGGGGMSLSNIPTAQGANDQITLNAGQVNFTADRGKAVNVVVLGQASASKMPRTGAFTTTASPGAGLNFAYDPAADAFHYTHSGASTNYTLELSTVDPHGNAVNFTTQPASIHAGETHTISPTWAQLAGGVGTVQVRTAAGGLTNNAMR
jgi:hypothetical protein